LLQNVNCSCSACRSNKTTRQIREVAAECELLMFCMQIKQNNKTDQGSCCGM